MVEVFNAHLLNTKIIDDEAKLFQLPIVSPKAQCCSGFVVGGPAQEFPPYFFQKILAGMLSPKNQKFGWWYGKTTHLKSCLTNF
jgi:hypothetical protein